jgi:hypothetical protein
MRRPAAAPVYIRHDVGADYKENNVSADGEKGRENKRARVTRVSRNPKHGKRKHNIVHRQLRQETRHDVQEIQ